MRRALLALTAIAAVAALPAAATAQTGKVAANTLEWACPTEPMPPPATQRALSACAAFVAALSRDAADRADALAALANLQINIFQNDAALAPLEEALAIDPDHLDAGVLKVEALLRLGRWPEAREDIERLKALYPGEPRVLRQYAQLVALVGSPQDALAALDEALAAQPDFWPLRNERVRLLTEMGRTEDAIAELGAIIDAIPQDIGALSMHATLSLIVGDAEAVIEDVDRARAIGLNDGANEFLAARAALMLGRFEEALTALDKAVGDPAFHDQTPLLPLYRFAVLDRLGREQEAERALEAFAEAAEIDPQFVLQVQVFLRNMGFEEVEISGKLDDATKQRFATCLTTRTCASTASRAI